MLRTCLKNTFRHQGEVRGECHTVPFPFLFMIGPREGAILPLPSGAGVLLFQRIPLLHPVLSLGGGLNVCHRRVLLYSCSQNPGPELKTYSSVTCYF